MRYIIDMREGERINDIYLIKSKVQAVSKNGKPYDSIILQDKTGTLDAKIWDPESQGIDDYEVMDYVFISGDLTVYNNAPQLKVNRLRKADEGEYLVSDYMPSSEYDIEDMYTKLMEYVDKVKNPYLNKLIKSFFAEDEEFIKSFKNHSAAKTMHHGFIGGLLEHTLSVTSLCENYAKRYKILNHDLLVSAAIMHDIGKVYELSDFPMNDYTDEGQLLGHITMGMEMVGERIRTIEGFPVKLANELKHCILAHHGELEYGSPKKPALPEAVALSFADNLDAKMEQLKELFAAVPEDNNEWLGFNKQFDTRMRRASKFDA